MIITVMNPNLLYREHINVVENIRIGQNRNHSVELKERSRCGPCKIWIVVSGKKDYHEFWFTKIINY
jgi:hypothetical protein